MRLIPATALLLIALLPSHGQQQQEKRHDKSDIGGNSPSPASPSFVVGNQQFGGHEQKSAAKNEPGYWEKWKDPMVLCTIGLILVATWAGLTALQTLTVAGRSAKAAEDNAAFLVESERAWLTATVENPEEPPERAQFVWIEVPIVNRGKTPARIKSVFATSKLIPIPSTAWTGRPGELPKEPDYSDGNKLIALTERDIIIAPTDSLRHIHVFIFPEEWKQVRRRELSLYVYGYVEYLDTVKGLRHETKFCSIYWVPQPGSNEPTGFMFSQIIPAAYFSAT